MHIRTDLLARVEKAAAACTDLTVVNKNLKPNSVSFFCNEVQEIWQRRQTTLISINQANACTDIEVAKSRYLETPFASEEGKIWKRRLVELIEVYYQQPPTLIEDAYRQPPLVTDNEVNQAIQQCSSGAAHFETRILYEKSLIAWLSRISDTYDDLPAFEKLIQRFDDALFDMAVLARIYDEHWDELALPHALIDAPQCTDIYTVVNRMDECIDDGKAQLAWKKRWHELALETARAEVPACTDRAIAEQKLLEVAMPPESEAELLWVEKIIDLSYPE